MKYSKLENYIDKIWSKNISVSGNEQGNIPLLGVVPRFSDLEIVSLSIASEAMGIYPMLFLFFCSTLFKTR